MSSKKNVFTVLLLVIVLAGCSTRKQITSAADVPKGASLVITSTYTKTWRSKTLLREPGWSYGRVADLSFIQFKPQHSAFWRFKGTRDEIKAYAVRPGTYTFWSIDNGDIIANFDRSDQQFTFTVGEGEAVYIGDIVINLKPGDKATIGGARFTTRYGSFQLEADDRRDRAKAYFDANFGGSDLKFRVDLAKHETFEIPKITAFRKKRGLR